MNSHEKGFGLEKAVKAIKQAILTSEGEFGKDSIEIVPRKLIFSGGVRHEIDLYVEIMASKGYGSAFIFECKSHGIMFRGMPVTVNQMFDEKVKYMIDNRLKVEPTSELPDGEHTLRTSDDITFSEGELLVDGKMANKCNIEVEFATEVVRTPVKLQFEVSTRGHYVSFAKLQLDESNSIQTEIVAIKERSKLNQTKEFDGMQQAVQVAWKRPSNEFRIVSTRERKRAKGFGSQPGLRVRDSRSEWMRAFGWAALERESLTRSPDRLPGSMSGINQFFYPHAW